MERRHRGRIAAAVLLTLATVAALTGCAPSSSGGGRELVVWSLETQPDRVAKTQKILAGYTAKTGEKVKLVAVDENQVPQLIASAALSGDLPDVVGGLSLSLVRQFETQKLLDSAAAAKVVDALGPKTFSASALALDRQGGRQLAVPDSAYAQILVYRTDLFAKAGLAPPTTYAKLLKAAKTLTRGGDYGISLATDPSDVFTSQSFESLALGNDCQLVDGSGDIALTSKACDETFDLYGKLAAHYSPSGTQTVDSTRASYFAGQAAMVDWSTFLLDELAGLRNDALPTCDQCRKDPTWLAKHSGIVTSVTGPDGKNGGTYGEITSWALLRGSSPKATGLVNYMLSDGYTDWLGLAPEGKIPVRTGDAQDPQKYSRAWLGLKAGVDKLEPLSKVYSAKTIASLQDVPSDIDRWAIPQGQGALLGPLNTELPIPAAIADIGAGSSSIRAAQEQAAAAVEQIKTKVN